MKVSVVYEVDENIPSQHPVFVAAYKNTDDARVRAIVEREKALSEGKSSKRYCYQEIELF